MESGAPETLYDLCDMTAYAIETQPTNYYQDLWAHPVLSLSTRYPHYKEACGTAYCRAGWMVNLAEKNPRGCDNRYLPSKAKNMLVSAGIPESAIYTLFEGGAVRGIPGTKEYAKRGAEGIRKFMETYEKELKSKKVSEFLKSTGELRTGVGQERGSN